MAFYESVVIARPELTETQIDKLINDLSDIITKDKGKVVKKEQWGLRSFSYKINPCTKTFQAIRIFVNKEITELINGIINAAKILKPGGKILVVSFHSLEDKIIKYFFSNFSKNKSRTSRYFPENEAFKKTLFNEYKNKVIRPSKQEVSQNKRSRSAKLRFAIRSNDEFEYPEDLKKKFKKYLDLEAINV